ncbi:MAG TPA: hypothetical protein VGX78_08225 [Pirellulales bacterium]|jgi:hypothetical protein|nr:hypothetical protein [Pirellulales bacterium]
MRRFLVAIAIALLFLVVVAGLAWFYFERDPLGRQVAGYRVGAAENYAQACREIAWFEQGADREPKLRELVAGWGTGNQRFDLYLARYLGDPKCSEALRQAFSLEFAWRPQMLPRWAHYWRWRSKLPPADEIASIDDYLAALLLVDPPKKLTWREVLDQQAVFELSGDPELAKRLAPDNWPARYQRWIESSAKPRDVTRPRLPFPDWQGPAPKE